MRKTTLNFRTKKTKTKFNVTVQQKENNPQQAHLEADVPSEDLHTDGFMSYVEKLVFWPNEDTRVIIELTEGQQKAIQEAYDEVTADSEREQKIKELAEKAEKEGEEQFLEEKKVGCNNPRAECNVDLIGVYVNADGETVEKRTHLH